MNKLVSISNVDKFTSLVGIVNDVAPYLVNHFYSTFKNKYEFIWSDYCFNHCENAAQFMIDTLNIMIDDNLSHKLQIEIENRFYNANLYQEMAQFNQIEPDEQFIQEVIWNREEAQNDFDDKLAMYYNEY